MVTITESRSEGARSAAHKFRNTVREHWRETFTDLIIRYHDSKAKYITMRIKVVPRG